MNSEIFTKKYFLFRSLTKIGRILFTSLFILAISAMIFRFVHFNFATGVLSFTFLLIAYEFHKMYLWLSTNLVKISKGEIEKKDKLMLNRSKSRELERKKSKLNSK